MKMIVCSIDPRHHNVLTAVTTGNKEILPKTVAKQKEKPLVVIEVRNVISYGCR